MPTNIDQSTQTLHLTLDSGMDQRTHPRQTQAGGQVLEAVNVRYNKLGGVEKRAGLTSVDNVFFTSGRAFSGGVQGKLIPNDNELVVTDGYHIGSRSVALGNGHPQVLVERGQAPEAVSKLRPIESSQYQLLGQDTCYSIDGLIFHAWLAGVGPYFSTAQNDIFTSVEDAQTGALIVAAESQLGLGAWWPPRLVSCGSAVYLMWCDNILKTGPNNLYYKKWNRATMSWGAKTTLRSDLQGDFAVFGTNGFIYVLLSAANVVRITRYTSLLTINADTAIEVLSGTDTAHIGLSISARQDDAVVWATYSRFNTATTIDSVRAVALDSSLNMTFAAPFTVYAFTGWPLQVAVAIDESTNNCVFAIQASLNAADTGVFPVFNVSGSAVGNATPANRSSSWMKIASRPFVIGDGSSLFPKRAYVFVLIGGAIANTGINNSSTPAQYTHMLIELGIDSSPVVWSPRPITWQAPRYASISGMSPFTTPTWGMPSIANLGNGTVACDAIIKRNNRQRVSLSTHLADFNPQNRFLTARLGQTVFMSPGFYWDKARLAEMSYAYWPQALDSSVALTGGSLPNGTYSYRALYEYVDANGLVHQSIPSDAMLVTVAGGTGNAVITIKVPALTVTSRQAAGSNAASIRIAIYRQVTTGSLSGAWLRLFAEGLEPVNDTTVQFISAIDNGLAFVAATSTEELYTDSGVFPNVMPAGFTACVTYRNRVWIAYGHTVNYSKSFVTGGTVNFTDAFELPFEESGDITAMWVMDDTLYVSTADRIYSVYGDGPNDFAQSNDIQTPNRIATDFGCIEPRSVVVTQAGTLYQSRAGIQLLSRNRTVSAEPIGSRVQADLANFPVITGANIHPDGRTCTFDCVNTAGNIGIRLVYDYSVDKWSRDTLLSGGDQSGAYVISEAVANGTKFALVSNGAFVSSRVFFENAATNLDDGQWITMSVLTGEIHPMGLQGNVNFSKWTFNIDRLGPHDLNVQFFKDYEDAAFYSKLLPDSFVSVADADTFSVNATVHRAQSMRMKMFDSQPSVAFGIGKGSSWIGLAAEVSSADNNATRLAATKKV